MQKNHYGNHFIAYTRLTILTSLIKKHSFKDSFNSTQTHNTNEASLKKASYVYTNHIRNLESEFIRLRITLEVEL